jgi:hypothetical protein
MNCLLGILEIPGRQTADGDSFDILHTIFRSTKPFVSADSALLSMGIPGSLIGGTVPYKAVLCGDIP